MIVEDFSIQLFVDDSVAPPFYWFRTSTQFDVPGCSANGFHPVSSAQNNESVLVADLIVSDATAEVPAQNPVIHEVELGEVTFHSLNVNLQLNSAVISSGTVMSKDAQQETRPWK